MSKITNYGLTQSGTGCFIAVPIVAIMGTAVRYPVPDRIKPSFVILTFGHSDTQP